MNSPFKRVGRLLSIWLDATFEPYGSTLQPDGVSPNLVLVHPAFPLSAGLQKPNFNSQTGAVGITQLNVNSNPSGTGTNLGPDANHYWWVLHCDAHHTDATPRRIEISITQSPGIAISTGLFNVAATPAVDGIGTAWPPQFPFVARDFVVPPLGGLSVLFSGMGGAANGFMRTLYIELPLGVAFR